MIKDALNDAHDDAEALPGHYSKSRRFPALAAVWPSRKEIYATALEISKAINEGLF